jgi:hypothetical protein
MAHPSLQPSVSFQCVGFLRSWRIIPWDHNYTFFGAQYRACNLAPSSFELPLPVLPVDFSNELLAKLCSCGTFADRLLRAQASSAVSLNVQSILLSARDSPARRCITSVHPEIGKFGRDQGVGENLTAGIWLIFRGLNFSRNADIGQIGHLWMGTNYLLCAITHWVTLSNFNLLIGSIPTIRTFLGARKRWLGSKFNQETVPTHQSSTNSHQPS